MKKNTVVTVAELGHSDLFPVYKSCFATMTISNETLNIFKSHSNRLICKWSPFKFMRLGNPRWPSAVVTKIAKT